MKVQAWLWLAAAALLLVALIFGLSPAQVGMADCGSVLSPEVFGGADCDAVLSGRSPVTYGAFAVAGLLGVAGIVIAARESDARGRREREEREEESA